MELEADCSGITEILEKREFVFFSLRFDKVLAHKVRLMLMEVVGVLFQRWGLTSFQLNSHVRSFCI